MFGCLEKMSATLLDKNGTPTPHYQLHVGEQQLPLNDLIGQRILLRHTGKIICRNCLKQTKKSYSQGYCYDCMDRLAACDMCVMKPEICHYAGGTCREPEWGLSHCQIPHYVYLANTSDLKVGITRHNQIPTRWIDQGATQALPFFKVKSRLVSGLIEILLARYISDKTNWRNLLKSAGEDLDLLAARDRLLPNLEEGLAHIKMLHGLDAFELLDTAKVVRIDYPVTEYPSKITSLNFDDTAEISGLLLGIKGQYLIFDTGVINIRKFTSYEVEVQCTGLNH